MSLHAVGRAHTSTRETILKVLAEKKDTLQPIFENFPFVAPFFLFKRMNAILELQVTDEMKEQIKTSLGSAAPPALMGGKEVLGMIKSMGLPLEMVQPIIEFVQSTFAGEINFYAVASSGFKFTIKLPGLDQVLAEFLKDEE